MTMPFSRWMNPRGLRRTLLGALGAGVVVLGLAGCGHTRGDLSNLSDSQYAQMRERMVDRVSRQLTLDASQKAKLTALADAMKTQRDAMQGRKADGSPVGLRDEVQALVAGPQFDRNAAQALLQSKTDAVRDGGPAVIQAAADFYDSLKPEQQQKVRDWMNRRGHGQGRHHGGHF